MPEHIQHPGARIKVEVIPKGMSVTRVAALLGVGRPALSNLLNGNSALSADMAARFEKAFSYPRGDLLKMQAEYDAAQAKMKSAPADVIAHVPPFLGIKANQIEQWCDHNIPARSRISVFLRTLVHSTGRALTKVDFPGNDDAERSGWDGVIEAGEGTPWVPEGRSGWEFGTNEDPTAKANHDIDKSERAHLPADRKEITFVFVTPRRWSGKEAWVIQVKKRKRWKDVRAYDSSNLEQWLEQSISAQAWFANETNIPAQDVRSLDRCWADWANVCAPQLTGALFSSAIDATKRTILSRLSNPSEGPTVIAADSTEEALAFLSQLFGERGGEELAAYRDRVLVFDKPGVLPRLAQGAQTFIPVAFTREVERELAPYAKSMCSFVVYPRNAANTNPHIVLEPANYDTFTKALEEIGMHRDDISRLSNESGRSLTVLRRRLATVPGVQTPHWAADHQTASSLVPFMLVGAWHSASETDKSALSLLAGDRPYGELEKECQRLAQLDDAPVWSIGTYRGVISKVDLLYAIASFVTPEDLKRYFSMARMVLGEDNPALDLAEDQRWAAAIHGKARQFSSVFREGISETMVLLAVHGEHLFNKRLGVHTATEAAQVVRDLLPAPLTTRVLEANDRDLPTYAEAAPYEFLSILEDDLKTEHPAVLGLLRPANPGVLGHPSRTGLLWALEGLSWNPETLPRAASILARLAKIEISDNWVNKPMNSLAAIFRAWMPQTAAPIEARIALMRMLAGRFPDIAWNICVTQIGTQHEVGHYSHKPRWRPDGYGFGDPLPTWEPILNFTRELLEMALNWSEHRLGTLSDLVEQLHNLDESDQARVWTLVETWGRDRATDAEKAAMREKIRTSVLSRRAVIRAKKHQDATTLTERAKAAYDALEPSDLLNKHAWLFRNMWVEESADELGDSESYDIHKRATRIQEMRLNAMREIIAQHGIANLLVLVKRSKASREVGYLAARDLLTEEQLLELLHSALQPVLNETDDVYPFKELIAGAIAAISDVDKRDRVLKSVVDDLSEEAKARLLVLAPFRRSTWRLVDVFGDAVRVKYWREVSPEILLDSDEEINEGVEYLIKSGRPRAAFSCVHFHPDKLDPLVLYRLLSEVVKGGNDQPNEYLLESYDVESAFKHLNSSQAITLEQKATLEFAFLDVLAPLWNSPGAIPNLERYIQDHPELFVQVIAWLYKRSDGGVDSTEFQLPSGSQEFAERSYKLLKVLKRIPGYDVEGVLSAELLLQWVSKVRQSCNELSRGEVADIHLGELLSHSQVGKDGVWPCEPVRQVMEEIQSERIMRGARTGVFNSRGIHARGKGGEQERELANRYRTWAQAIQLSHPYVSSNLLMELAKTYEREGSREDTESEIRTRLPPFH